MRKGDGSKTGNGSHPSPPPGQPGRSRRAGIPWNCNKHVNINSSYRCIASHDREVTQVCKEEECSNKCAYIPGKTCLYLRSTSECSSTCITWSHCNEWRKTAEVSGLIHRFIHHMECSIGRALQLACGPKEQIFLQCYQAFNSSTIHRYESYCNDAMLTKLPWNGLELCEGKYDCNPPTTNYTNYEISYLCSVLSKKISRPPGPVTIRCGDRMETTSSISTNGRSGTSARPEDDSTLQPRTSEDQSGSTALPTQLSETPKITTASSALINVTENTLRPEHGTVRIGSLDNLPAGEVASGVVGAVLFVICVILVTALLLRRKRRSPLETSNSRNHISANIDDVLVLGDSHINHDYASVNHAEMRDMEPYVNAAVIDGQLTDDAGQHPMNNQQASLRQEYPAPGVYDTLQGGAVDHVYTRIRNTQSVDYVDVSSDTTLSRETTTNNHHTEEYVNDIENAELE